MTNAAKDIVLYGVSGYTGKLIAESLHKRGIAFTAAGRNEERIKAALELVSERVGGATINAEIAVVAHEEEALTALFKNAKIIANVTGPFAQIGETVVKAALAADCHYIDTTGEQDFMIAMKAAYSEAFAAKGLLLAPACSYMWTFGALAAEVCLETPGVDSLDLTYLSERGVPSVASTQSFMRMLALPQYFLLDNAMTPWPIGQTFDTVVDGSSIVYHGSSWGGAAEPVWYEDDARVQNCRVVQCAENGLMDMIIGGVNAILEQAGDDPAAIEAAAIAVADSITADEPDKELPEIHRGVVSCKARGTLASTTTTIVMHSSYVVTGELIAEGCKALLGDWSGATGFTSPATAFGHRELLKVLTDGGFVSLKTS